MGQEKTANLCFRAARMLRNPSGLDPTAGMTTAREKRVGVWEAGLALRFRKASVVGVAGS